MSLEDIAAELRALLAERRALCTGTNQNYPAIRLDVEARIVALLAKAWGLVPRGTSFVAWKRAQGLTRKVERTINRHLKEQREGPRARAETSTNGSPTTEAEPSALVL